MPPRRKQTQSLTPVQALTGKFNPLEYYLASGMIDSNIYSSFCNTYISYKPIDNSNNCVKITLNSLSTEHCGYCSDNDGTTYETEEENTIVYVALPPELEIEQCTALFEPINTISTCYCGINNLNYKIINLRKMNSG